MTESTTASSIDVMISHKEIDARLPTLAAEIAAALPESAHSRGIVMIGLLKGAIVFMSDLARALQREGIAIEIDCIWVSSYGAATESSGSVLLRHGLTMDIAGRDVLLVDDIVDTGRTIAFVHDHLAALGPASVQTVVFLDKPARRVIEVPVEHVGFTIPDRFVIGYGTDYAERYRELPFLGILQKD